MKNVSGKALIFLTLMDSFSEYLLLNNFCNDLNAFRNIDSCLKASQPKYIYIQPIGCIKKSEAVKYLEGSYFQKNLEYKSVVLSRDLSYGVILNWPQSPKLIFQNRNMYFLFQTIFSVRKCGCFWT